MLHHSPNTIPKDKMHIKLGQRHIHSVESTVNHYKSYDNVFWDVELVDVPDCWNELQRSDVWDINPAVQGAKRHSCLTGHHNSDLLNQVGNLPTQYREEFIRAAGQADIELGGDYFKKCWYRDVEYYIKHSHTFGVIFHDEPGFEMGIHLDNHHIMLQLIVNLTDNDSGTEMYDIVSSAPYHRLTGEKNKGIMFLNSPGALHSIGHINKDRYILYSAVMYGGDK